MEKWPILDQNHGLIPLERFQLFDFFNFFFLYPRKTKDLCFLGGGTHNTRDMCFPGGGTHNTNDMCFPGGGTHNTRDMCFLGGGTHNTKESSLVVLITTAKFF